LVLWLYRLVFLLLTPVILLLLLLRSAKNPQYRERLVERLGFLSAKLKPHSIIIHAASVGEVIAIKSVVEKLLAAQPNTTITVTCFTPTGSTQIKKLFEHRVQHCYLPLDNFISTWLFLKRLKPQLMVFMETELWPNLIAQSSFEKIPLVLINARLSAKSCRQYQKIRWLIQPTIQAFNALLAQSKAHQQNFIDLGAKIEQCSVLGNLKYDISLTNEVESKVALLTECIVKPRMVWLVASTHAGDDEIILSAFKIIKQQFPALLLILVPRHPERFNDIAKLCTQAGFNTARRSEVTPVNAEIDIWLLDSLGELVAAYALADIVTMGGTFSHIGGHNPLEAALFKKALVVGADMINFTEVLNQLSTNNAIIQLTDQHDVDKQLAEIVTKLLNNDPLRKQLGEQAFTVMQANQGASDKTLAVIRQLL